VSRWARAAITRIFPLLVLVRRLYRRTFRPVTVGVRAMIVHEDHLLLVRQHSRTEWEMPGGAAGRGESLRQATVREAHEETGVEVIAERLLGMYSAMIDGMTNHIAVYVCRPGHDSRELPPLPLNIEIAEARYWPINGLPPVTDRHIQRRIAEYESGRSGFDGAN
jgi:8-oxo-dGTP diphosphatase